MNKEKMLEVADFLEKLDSERFRMQYWASTVCECEVYGSVSHYTMSNYVDINVCNTAGCIAGWAIALENGGRADNLDIGNSYINANRIRHTAATIFGITDSQASRLFFADDESVWIEYFSSIEHLTGIEEIEDEHLENSGWITNKVAAEMLRMIVNGEVEL